MKAIYDSFTIGGKNGHPSLPGDKLQRMIGSTIRVNVGKQVLFVPTDRGEIMASKGDTIVLYEDGSLDVIQPSS